MKFKSQHDKILWYGISKGEYSSVKAAVGGMDFLIDENSKVYTEQFIKHLARVEDIEERLLTNPSMFKTPIVRNGKQATIGFQPDVWKTWA